MVASLIAGLFLALGTARAADEPGPTPERRADWDQRLEQAKSLQKQAVEQKALAKAAYEARQKECYKKFRVYACQEEARREYVEAAAKARRVENEGKTRERQVKKEELADKDARRLAEEPQREAERQAREDKAWSEREHSAATAAEKLQAKEQKAAAGAARAAADEERVRKKREQHERKVAEKMEKARRQKAETGQ